MRRILNSETRRGIASLTARLMMVFLKLITRRLVCAWRFLPVNDGFDKLVVGRLKNDVLGDLRALNDDCRASSFIKTT